MSAPKEYSIQIEYQTSLGEIQATWETGGDIEVSFANSETISFQILVISPTWGHQVIDATAQDTHETVLPELITRFRDIQITSATHSSEFSGELNLVLSRSEDNELLIKDI